ncbi:MAG: 50S ribosomal protein L29 [Flavobacteriaceae bacterium]|jgi:large subunit ribosomal protein L29
MKQAEINSLSIADVDEKIQELQKQFEELKMTHAISPLENPAQIRSLRRTIARLQTAKTQKEQETL